MNALVEMNDQDTNRKFIQKYTEMFGIFINIAILFRSNQSMRMNILISLMVSTKKLLLFGIYNSWKRIGRQRSTVLEFVFVS